MSRPVQALIDLSALEHNLAIVRRHAPHSRIMAVVKADAYGHGLLRAASALQYADGLAMLELDAAVRLREAGCRQKILLIEGFFSLSELAVVEEYQLSTVIHHGEQLTMLPSYRGRGKLDVFLKLNTGMNRLGFAPQQFTAVMETLRSSPAIGQITLMTHFACADEPGQDGDTAVDTQWQQFNVITAGYHLPRSLANSAAILRYPMVHADWVRPGLMLYGASPFPDKTAVSLGLQAAMTVSSKIITIQHLATGEGVGYGHTFRAPCPMRTGVVAGGYADGYPRHAPTGTPVLVNGQRARLIGRVSMDMLHVDLSGIEGAETGSDVILWGEGLPVEEVAQAAGTISYELLCALAPRMQKKT